MMDFKQYLDLDLFWRLRKEKGFTLQQVEGATGVKATNLCDFEHGRIMLSLPRLQKILRFYEADLFQIHDMLRLRLLPPDLLRDFRRACARHGTTPSEALLDFMIVFSGTIK